MRRFSRRWAAYITALAGAVLLLAGAAPVLAEATPQVEGSPQNDFVRAQGFAAGAPLTFTIRDAPGGTILFGPAARTADSNGHYFLGRGEHGLDLLPGRHAEVTDGTTTRAITLENLTVTLINAATNVVSGTATPNQTGIQIGVFNPSGGSSLTVDADGVGNWSADFDTAAPPFDIDAQTHANARIFDAEGDATVAELGPPSIHASLSFDNVFANNFAPSSSVTFTIRSSPGGTILDSGTKASDGSGYASFNRFQDHNVDLGPGMEIEVTDGTATKTLTLVTLTIDAVNPSTDDVSGTAPASAEVQVNVNQPGGGGTGTQVAAAGDGSWTADFSGLFDITAGTGANASVRDADGDTTGFDKPAPSIHASLTFDNVFANNFAPSGSVTFTIRDSPGGTVLASGTKATNASGNASFNRFEDHDLELAPGMHVQATDGTATKELTLVNVTVDVVNAATDVVSGTAPAGAQVQVNIGDQTGGTGASTTADGSGSWSIDFSPFDVTAGMFASADVPDADGDTTKAEKPPASINASLTCDCVNANNFAPSGSVTLTIRDSPGGTVLASGTKTTDANGNASFNRFEDHDVDLVPGMHIEATDGTTAKELTLVDLTINAVNPSTDDVSGTAPPGAQIQVNVNQPGGGGTGTQVTAAGDGSWTADFSGLVDITAGSGANASVADADGDQTSFDKQPPAIDASLTFDGIFAEAFAANGSVTFTIRESPGGTVLASGTKATDGGGQADFNRFEDHDVDLMPGMHVEVTDGTATKELTLVALTIDTVDPATDDVTGTAPAGAQVEVNVNEPGGGGGAFKQVTAAGDGSWTADFSGLFDIDAGTGAQASVADADGDQTFFNKQPPSIHASLTFDNVFVNGFAPLASVTMTIRESPGGAVLATASKGTDANGSTSFERFEDHDVELAPGMHVEVTDGTATKELTLVNVTIDVVNAATDVVSGTAPAGADVAVNVGDDTGGTGASTTADGAGNWTVDFSPFDLTPTMFASADVADADGDTTKAEKQPPRIEGVLTADGVFASGFAANASVTFTIRDSPGGAVLASGSKPTDGGGNAEFNRFEDHDIDLVPGMHIEVTDGTDTKQLTLVTLTIVELNAATDVVSGAAPAGAQVHVNVGDDTGGTDEITTADGAGNWSIDFSPFDLTATMSAHAAVRDGDGDQTAADKEPPSFTVDVTFDGVFGGGFAPDASVDVEVRDAPGGVVLFTDTVPTDGDGNFEINTEGTLDIVSGNEVTVSDGVATKVHVVVDLTIDTVDPATETVSGTAPAGAELHVSVGDEAELTVTADGTGAWTADFSGLFDIDATTVANANVFDDDGDATTVEKQPPVIHAFLDFDGIEGYGFTPNSSVTVEIRSAPGVNPPLFADSAVPTDGSGAFFLDPFAHGVDLVPGMAITVTGSTKLLVLVDLTMDAIDPVTDVVSGTAPPGAQVDLFLFDPSGETEASVTADGSGVWSVDFSGTFDIGGRTDVGVSVPDADGDRTRLDDRRPAQIEWASLSHDSVCPRGFGGAVTVEIRNAAGKRLWKGPIPAGLSGCVGRDVHGQDLVAGMLVSATDGAITKNLTLATLTIDSVDVTTGLVTGTAPAGAQVALSFGGPGDVVTTVDATGAGEWTADLSGSGLDVNVEVWALVADAEGDNTQVARQGPVIAANLTLDKVEGCGFALDSTVSVAIDSFTSGPVPTDGGGCFGFDASAQDLATGKVVSVTDGTLTRELTLPVLTMNVDFAGGVISGTAPPGAEVEVGFGVVDEEKGDGMTVVADGAGNWTADFGELEPNLEIGAGVRDSDGDRTGVSWFADLHFSTDTYTVPESAGSITITVNRIGTAHVEVGASFATSDGSATAASDYAATSGALAFPDGVTSQTFTVPIVDDTDAEGDEVLNLTLSNPTGGAALVTPSTATITIEDDDGVAPTLAFSSATYSVGEGGGRATITVERSGDPNVAVGVSFATSDGTATAGSDYTAATGTLAFSPGEMLETFDVRVNDDAAFEGDETVNLALSPTGGAVLGDPSAATLTIVENEAPPTVQFAQATFSALENGGTVALTVTRAGPTGNAFSVNYALVPGTATEGSDFTFTPGTLAFGKNDTSKIITVPITNDGASESAEDFGVQLASPSGGVALGSPSEATVVIAASDQQPDAMVSASAGTGFLGDNVYNTTGDGQTLSATGSRNATTVVYFRIQNDGTTENTVVVAGPSSPARTTLRYFLQADGSEITSLVQAGAFQATLPAGGHVVIRAELAISSKAKVGTSIGFSLTGTWTGDAVRQDTARAVVGVVS